MTDASNRPAAHHRWLRASLLAVALALGALAALLALRAAPLPMLLAVLVLLVAVPTALATGWTAALARVLPAPRRRLAPLLGGAAMLGTLWAAYAGGVALLDRALAARDHAAAYAGCAKVWSSRGLVEAARSGDASAGNDAAALAAAFARGAPGVEVDVFYDPALGDYVVSHDFPYRTRDGVLLTLEALLAASDPSRHYWLDFKRHQKLTRLQAEDAAARLASIAERTGVARERLWVEATEPANMMPFVRAGFRTVFDVHPPRDDHPLLALATQLHKAVYLAGGFTVMGMNAGTREAPIYGPRAAALLGDVPLFLYHLPSDRGWLAELAARPQVRVLLPGDHSADLFDLDRCSDPGTAP
jgi:hypothetical protein